MAEGHTTIWRGHPFDGAFPLTLRTLSARTFHFTVTWQLLTNEARVSMSSPYCFHDDSDDWDLADVSVDSTFMPVLGETSTILAGYVARPFLRLQRMPSGSSV